MNTQPVTLEGIHVRLEPLSLDHHAALCAVGLAGDVFRWFPEPVQTAEQMRQFIETALAGQRAGTVLPFATVDRKTGQPVGSTRFGNIDCTHRRVEIGWTWLAPAWQRTPFNTEAKHLMLRHAFETLGCLRVELKTDSLNEKSRQAMLRIGCQEEGTFRNHIITASGRIRHSVWFSVIDREWPDVKARLEGMLARPWESTPAR